MRENDWTNTIKDLLINENLGEGIYVETLQKVPYAKEIISYDEEFNSVEVGTMDFETDLLIYEKAEVIKPRVIIEAKVRTVSTHDAITYSYKALQHKTVTPFVRYGIMLGNRKHHPIPGRLYRHGSNFDFMISFKGYDLTKNESSS